MRDGIVSLSISCIHWINIVRQMRYWAVVLLFLTCLSSSNSQFLTSTPGSSQCTLVIGIWVPHVWVDHALNKYIDIKRLIIIETKRLLELDDNVLPYLLLHSACRFFNVLRGFFFAISKLLHWEVIFPLGDNNEKKIWN